MKVVYITMVRRFKWSPCISIFSEDIILRQFKTHDIIYSIVWPQIAVTLMNINLPTSSKNTTSLPIWWKHMGFFELIIPSLCPMNFVSNLLFHIDPIFWIYRCPLHREQFKANNVLYCYLIDKILLVFSFFFLFNYFNQQKMTISNHLWKF